MTSIFPEGLVSTEWLAEQLTNPTIKILDCTWHHPSTHLDGRTQYRGRHLPGSVHFDIDQIADRTTSLPHMLPTAADFAHKVGLLGIGNADRVIVYDRLYGGSAAARVWWMFRVFGHADVAMLDGGYGKWNQEKRRTEMTPVRPQATTFEATFNVDLVRSLADMRANLQNGATQVIDARGPGKFDGTQDDVFAFRRQGHIPNAVNVPWADLIDPENGTLLGDGARTQRFAAAGIDLQRPIVTTCASGIMSGVVALALYRLGHSDAAIYDGSWAEWSLSDHTPAAA